MPNWLKCLSNAASFSIMIYAKLVIQFLLSYFLDSRLRGNDKCGAFSLSPSFLIAIMIGFGKFSELSVVLL